ncbi:hypothetical protein C2U69_32040 [Cupriavidus pinatubonensis]|nr:hypothetical protein C2U69_32040 [Cupriavidus pinatubonensis]
MLDHMRLLGQFDAWVSRAQVSNHLGGHVLASLVGSDDQVAVDRTDCGVSRGLSAWKKIRALAPGIWKVRRSQSNG